MLSNSVKALEIRDQVSIMDFLNRLGFHPQSKSANELIFLSPLRDSDTTPSFSVNNKLDVWFDHGMGKGGNIIDFALLYWKGLSFPEVIQKIQDTCNLVIPENIPTKCNSNRKRLKSAIKIPNYKIETIKPYGGNEIINSYLNSRGVLKAAAYHISEVYYYVEDEKKLRKHFFAAGWQNELGGWEVRNKYFKGCLGKKAITFIKCDPKHLAVFEGFFNFLSWLTDNPDSTKSIIVLNSLSLLDSGIHKAKSYSHIDLYFDRDKAGFTAFQTWLKALPYSIDRSSIYDGYNDYNDKIVTDIRLTKHNA